MLDHIVQDCERVAILRLSDGQTLTIPESDWPVGTDGEDSKSARAWTNLTGLRVTIRTTLQTTATPGGIQNSRKGE